MLPRERAIEQHGAEAHRVPRERPPASKEEGVARAYVKINVAAGREREVRDALLGRDEVRSADLTSGDQDIIALVEAKSFDELLDLTLNQLRTIDGVTGTVTNLVIDKDEDPPQIG
jgi:DNA-binding Lrp family transcriptional regulator